MALAARGLACRLLNRNQDAIDSFEASLRSDPESTWFLAELGEALRREGRLEEALAQLDRALRERETGWNIGTRGQILYALGRTDEGIHELERAVEVDPTLEWAHNELGHIYVQLGSNEWYERAVESFDRALALPQLQG